MRHGGLRMLSCVFKFDQAVPFFEARAGSFEQSQATGLETSFTYRRTTVRHRWHLTQSLLAHSICSPTLHRQRLVQIGRSQACVRAILTPCVQCAYTGFPSTLHSVYTTCALWLPACVHFQPSEESVTSATAGRRRDALSLVSCTCG